MTPPLYSLLADGTTIRVIRVKESFEVEQVTIPFEQRIVRNEALPAGETRLVQAGQNGTQEITYRVLSEDGVETSRTPLRTTILKDAVPEILMIGAASSFHTVALHGSLVYADSGNAWILSRDSSNRYPLAASGDLDFADLFAFAGRAMAVVFPQPGRADQRAVRRGGSRRGYAVRAGGLQRRAFRRLVALPISEPSLIPRFNRCPARRAGRRSTICASISFDDKKTLSPEQILLDPQTAGSYSWWGMEFAWAPDGTRLAYSRPDEIGWISKTGGALHPLLTITPFRTLSDWVWLPPINWSFDGKFLFTVVHGEPVAGEAPEESPAFDLTAIPTDGSAPDHAIGPSRHVRFSRPRSGAEFCRLSTGIMWRFSRPCIRWKATAASTA